MSKIIYKNEALFTSILEMNNSEKENHHQSDILMNSNGTKFPPLRIFLISLLVTIGASFHYGYQLTLTSPAEEAFVHFVNNSISGHYGLNLDKNKLEVGQIDLVFDLICCF